MYACPPKSQHSVFPSRSSIDAWSDVAAVRPTVEVDGQATNALSAGLLRLNAVENAAGVHRCEVVFKTGEQWAAVERLRRLPLLRPRPTRLRQASRVLSWPAGPLSTALLRPLPRITRQTLRLNLDRGRRPLSRSYAWLPVRAHSRMSRLRHRTEDRPDHGLTHQSIFMAQSTNRRPVEPERPRLSSHAGPALRRRAPPPGQQLSLKSRANSGSETLSDCTSAVA